MTGDPFYKPEIKPYIAFWQKEGMTEEGRQEDSVACGASRATAVIDDVMFPSEVLKAERTNKWGRSELTRFERTLQ